MTDKGRYRYTKVVSTTDGQSGITTGEWKWIFADRLGSVALVMLPFLFYRAAPVTGKTVKLLEVHLDGKSLERLPPWPVAADH